MNRLRLLVLSVLAASVVLATASSALAVGISLPPALGGFEYKACFPQHANTGVVSGEGVYRNSYVANGQPSNMGMGGGSDNYFCLTGAPLGYGNVTFSVDVYPMVDGTLDLNNRIEHYDASISALLPKFITEGPSSGQVGTPFATKLQIYTDPGSDLGWQASVVGGTLPPGLSISGNGHVSGTPTAGGTYTFTLQYDTPAVGWNTSSRPRHDFTLSFEKPVVLELTPAVAPTATAYAPYSQALTTGGGTAPYTYAITEGTLPPGLTLAPTGAVTGVPTKAGTYQFTIRATDALGFSTSRQYTITIGWPALRFEPQRLAAAVQNKAYYGRVRAFDGRGPYTYSLVATSKKLPRGLTLAPTGIITGKPKVYGTFTFTVAAVDVNGAPGERTYTLKVAKAKPVKKKKKPKPTGKP